MRKVVATVLLVTVVVATLLVLLSWPAPPPVELMSVSAKSVGSINGKNYKRVTVSIKNRSRVTIYGSVSEIEIKVGGQWIDVDPGDGRMEAGKTFKQRFYVQEEAEACRLHFEYYVDYQQPISPRQQALGKLGPWAVKTVWKVSPLRKWFQDELEPGEKWITFETKIPPGATTSDQLTPSAPN